MMDWWNSLSSLSQVFYCIAIPSTLLLLIQTVLLFIGIGDEADGVDAEMSTDVSDALPDDVPDDVPDLDGPDATDLSDAAGWDSLKLFTLRGIVAFFVTFGWVGIVMDSAGAAIWASIPVAFLCGVGIMLLLAMLFRWLMKLRSDGNLDNRNALGTAGKVYLTIPASRTGEGKVQIMLQGVFVERNAVTDDESPIPTGAEVVVIGVSGQTDLVVKKK